MSSRTTHHGGGTSAPDVPLPPPGTGLDELRGITVSHRTVGIGALAEHSLDADTAAALHASLTAAGIESVVLATCNRSEVYWRARTPGDDTTVAQAFATAAGLPAPVSPLIGGAAATHLFRVCAGLESLVLGEAEILGQVRGALETSPGAGPFVRGVVQAALRAGGMTRSETALGVGAQSVASAAVQLVARQLPLGRSRVLVVGAGATGVKVARHLRALGVGRLVMANRTLDRAIAAAATLGAEPVTLDGLDHALTEAHAVICAVDAPAYMIGLDQLRDAVALRSGQPLLVVDLSMPQAVEPGEIPGVIRIDLTTLEQAVAGQLERRAAEIPKALAVIERELRYLDGWARRHALRPFVSDLRRKVESIRRAELARAEEEMARPDSDRSEVLDRLSRRLLDQMLAIPLASIENARVAIDTDQARYLRRLFALDDEADA